MASSPVEICSNALRKLGADAIISLSDDTVRAKLCNAFYAQTRDSVLAAYPWNFAVKRAALPALASAPLWGFANAFQLPADCLRVLDPEDDRAVWKVEGRTIVSDETAPLNIKYIAQITDTNVFSALFTETLTERLAAELAIPITKLPNVRNTFFEAYLQKLSEARSLDGQEGTQDVQEFSPLTDVR